MSTAKLAQAKRVRVGVARHPGEHDDAPLFMRVSGKYVPLLRKADAIARLQEAGLTYEQSLYRLLNAARTGAVASTLAHSHSWLYVASDVAAFADEMRAFYEPDQG